jgi:hypothetical protein
MLFLSMSVYATGYGGAQGENRIGQIIYFGSDDQEHIYVQKNQHDKDWKQYKTIEECPIWSDNKIVCKPNGKSPLAGATYKIMKSKTIDDGCGFDATVYKCVKGCENKSVPLLFIESPWEC